MNLSSVRGAVEHDDYFAIDDGGAGYRVAKAAMTPGMIDRVRRMYCGGVVRMAAGGMVPDDVLGGVLPEEQPVVAIPPPEPVPVETIKPPEPNTPDSLLGQLDQAVTGAPLPPPVAAVPEVVAPVEPVTPAFPAKPVVQLPVAPAPVAPAPVTPVAVTPAPVAAVAPVAAPVAEVVPAPVPAPVIAPETVVGPPAPVPPEQQTAGQRFTAAAWMTPGVTAELAPLVQARANLLTAEEQAAKTAEQIAARQKADAEADAAAADKYEADVQRIADQNKASLETAKRDYERRGVALRDTEAARVEAGRLFVNMGPWGTFLAALATIAGGAAAGVTGTANAAAEVIDRAIARDIESQRFDIAAKRSIRMQEYTAAGATVEQAQRLVTADAQSLVAARARATAAKSTTRAQRDAYEQLAATLEVRRAQNVQAAINDMSAAAVAAAANKRGAERDALAMRQAEQGMIVQRAQLGLEQRRVLLAERAAAAEQRRADEAQWFAMSNATVEAQKAAAEQQGLTAEQMGRLGRGLTPEQWATIKGGDSELYVPTINDAGEPVYRRALNKDDAAKVKAITQAKGDADRQLATLAKYIRAPGKEAQSITFDSAAKAEIEAAKQALVVSIKNIAELGALTGADMGLVLPRIPDPQQWFGTDESERATLNKLRGDLATLQRMAERNRLTLSADELAQKTAMRAAAAQVAPAEPVVVTSEQEALAPPRRQVNTDAQGRPVFAGESAEVPGFGSLFSSQAERVAAQRAAAGAASTAQETAVQRRLREQREQSARLRGER